MNQFNINRDRSVQVDKVFLVDRLFHVIDNGEIYPVSDLQIVANLNSNWECSFTVYKETNGGMNPLWDKITDLALVKIENKGIFELDAPITDESCTYKQCHGTSICESETSQTTMSLEINTPDDIARASETNPTDTYYEEFPTIFYRDLKDLSVFERLSGSTNAAKLQSLSEKEKIEILRKSSLLHRVFSEMPEYAENIKGDNIDESLKNLEYIFSWSDTSVYDICQNIAEEVQCIFIFDKFSRSFEVRDLKEHCEIDNCRDIEDGICPVCMQNGTTQKIVKFGEFSGVEIDTKNLAETIELTGDVGSVKNYFKIEGADDIITNRISNRLIGNGYLWKLGTLQKSQMSAELVNAIEAREKMMADNNYQEIYDGLWDEWNTLNEKISEYRSGMMPSPEMSDKKAEYVFDYLFGVNGKIDYAYASNRYQSATQIADSVMNYAKLLSPTNHTIQYTNLTYRETKWNEHDVIDTITFKIHIYLEGHYIENDESKGYADEYLSSSAVTLKVSKAYNISYSEGQNAGIYTTDYYNYLKRLIDTANAKSGITDEVITFEPITPFDISPDAESYHGVSLRPTHYSKYCYNRLDSFCKGYEACSAVVAGINSSISSNDTEHDREDSKTDIPPETVTDEIILSGQKKNEIGKVYFVTPLKTDLSYYKFQKGVTYTFTITTSSSYGFASSNIMCLLGTSGTVYPGSSNGLRSSTVIKKDAHTLVMKIKGDGNRYSHLCIGLGSKSDYEDEYLYMFHISMPSVSSDTSSESVDILKYLKADGQTGNIQEDLLGKYQQYILLLSGRMQWLNEQIKELEAKQSSLMDEIHEINEACDMENCLNDYVQKHGISQNLWHELCSFKRQDTYRNENFIGEGVDDVSLMKNIENLISRANEEIEKACNVVYSASATIDNLLVMPEFEKFWDKFTLGNYIHMIIDGHVHTMRLISITYNYGDLSKCSVDFSDIVNCQSSENDIKDILSQAASIATSAKTVARQAEEGASAQLSLQEIKNDALNIANSRIITADNQNFTMDRYGITGRLVDEISDEVSPEQIRIINNLLCFTDNAWGNTKTALGKITYLNPASNEYETSYGLIADTMIGNLMLSERLHISNENGSVYITGDGITLDSGAITWTGETAPIAKIERYYITTNTSNPQPSVTDSNWKTTLPSITDGMYLWQKTITSDSAGNTSTDIACMGGTDIISNMKTQYYESNSMSSTIGGTWSDTIPVYTSGSGDAKYIWTRDYIIYKSGETTTTNEIYNSALTNSVYGYGSFKDKVNTALKGAATTEIGADSVISPKIGGGYLYIVDGNNSITLNPHAGTVSDGTHTSSSNMLEVVSNNKSMLIADKNGNLQLGSGQIGSSNTVLLSPSGIESETSIAGSSGMNHWAFTANNTFGVTNDGKLYAENATVKGRIHATSGVFSGDITSDSINMTGGNLRIPIDTSVGETASSKKITVSTESLTSDEQIFSGSILNENEEGNSYFVIPFHSGSSYQFEKNVEYSFVISISSSYGFHSKSIMAVLGDDENVYPGKRNTSLPLSCVKRDLHTFILTFKGDGNNYSHLFIGLTSEFDFDKAYSYTFSIYKLAQTNAVSISPDGISFSLDEQIGKLSINNSGILSSDTDFYAPNLQEREWRKLTQKSSAPLSTSGIFSMANEIIVMVTADNDEKKYAYTWSVNPNTVDNNGIHLISGYIIESYKGFAEVILSTNTATIVKCIIAGNDYTNDATLTISYR